MKNIVSILLFLSFAAACFARDVEKIRTERLMDNLSITTNVSDSTPIYVRDCASVTVRVSTSALTGTVTVSETAQMDSTSVDTSFNAVPGTSTFSITNTDVMPKTVTVTVPPGYEKMKFQARTDAGGAKITIDAVAK